jgi:hypothetical protein
VLIHTEQLVNGLELVIEDQTRNYFGDYYRVSLAITARMPLERIIGLTDDERHAAAGIFGTTLHYARKLERMGVESAELTSVKSELLHGFTRTTFPYLNAPTFPAQLVRTAVRRKPARIEPSYVVKTRY